MQSYIKPTKTIEAVYLLRKREVRDQRNIRPFFLAFALLPVFFGICESAARILAAHTFYALPVKVIQWGALITVVLAMCLALLLPFWSVDFAKWAQYLSVSKVQEASHVHVQVNKNYGSSVILPLIKSSCPSFNLQSYYTGGDAPLPSAQMGEAVSFRFRNRCWTLKTDTRKFSKPFFPNKLALASYLSWEGHSCDKETLSALTSAYGKNRFEIEVPKFLTLFAEHAVAPFFVFQMFCVLLWCLDEYWMYSLFSGLMFVVFEGIAVTQSRASMSTMLKMGKIPVTSVSCKRNGEWQSMPSDALLPGDIVRISSSDSGACIPCDMVVLRGTVLVNEALLTGESTPQAKFSIAKRNGSDVLNNAKDHQHILYGGTSVISAYGDDTADDAKSSAIAFVIRTGFETEQGKLLTTIIHSSDRLTFNDRETFFFILFLLFFALIACWYVLRRGLGDPARDQWKLMLTCIRILTSVVPPELPMELSMAVNNALSVLTQMHIYCTQPHRIPLAGKIDYCCFDKTGTLTCDAMELHGITDESGKLLKMTDEVARSRERRDTVAVLGACNNILCVNGKNAGDPMEKAAMDAIGWVVKPNRSMGDAKGKRSVRIVTRFAFESALKRMSVIAAESGSEPGRIILSKGAPEIMQTLLQSVPAHYAETHESFARQGFRIIALAVKRIPGSMTESQVLNLTRTEVETGLTFVGFAMFSSQMKPDCESTMQQLKASGHIPIMITGDSDLTAIAVAKSVGILPEDASPSILRSSSNKEPHWESVGHEDVSEELAHDNVPAGNFCVNGEAYERALANNPSWMRTIAPSVRVWARCTPETKSSIVLLLKDLGYTTLFAGDGINDMAALKHAHVGIAVLNAPTPQETVSIDSNYDFLKNDLAQIPVPVEPPELEPVTPEDGFFANAKHVFYAKKREIDILDRREIIYVNNLRKQGKRTPLNRQTTMRLSMKVAQGAGQGEDAFEGVGGAPMVRLGDASIASPFTSKTSKVSAILDIIRMGRCSLVTTLQMYRIIALNCLTGAYSMSVLYSDGVKLGDYQMVVVSILISICFLWISKAKPLAELSPKRPFQRVFCGYIMSSILAQFAIHFSVFAASVYLVDSADYSSRLSQGLEVDTEEFKPTLLNTVMFLIYTLMTVATFAVNYQGEPFMTPLRSNGVLRNGLIALTAIIAVISLEIAPSFNAAMEIVPFPSAVFRAKLIALLCFDGFGAFFADRALLHYFS